jgi:hypothetical protein
MRNNLHDCPKNSRIYMGVYVWGDSERRPPCGSAVYIRGYVMMMMPFIIKQPIMDYVWRESYESVRGEL